MKDKCLLSSVPQLCDEKFNKDKSLLALKDKCLLARGCEGKGFTQRHLSAIVNDGASSACSVEIVTFR